MTALVQRTAIRSWYKIADPVWQGGRAEIQAGLPSALMSPVWQMLLLGNGSPTRLLQLLTQSPIAVEVIATELLGEEPDYAPTEINLIATPRVRRQIWLKTAKTDEILVYAVSWWHKDDLANFLPQPHLPVGTNLQNQRLELFRDLRGIYRGSCPELAGIFTAESSSDFYWGRHYLLWHGGRPITLIYEIFNPAIAKYFAET